VVLPSDTPLTATWEADLFGGITVITGEAARLEPMNWSGGLYQPQSQIKKSRSTFTFKAIPYCFWANREPGEMLVWIQEA
jgi:uncharacterized protein